MKFDLTGKHAIVTGGGSGIGRAISRAIAEQGAYAHILDYNKDSADSVVEEITSDGHQASSTFCDVSDTKQMAEVIGQIGSKAKLDILINNAGIAHVGNIEQTSAEDMDRLYAVNIKGIYNCARPAIELMKEQGGVIINIASIASTVAIAERFAYSMTKGAVLTMTYSIAKDYLEYGIRCNCISPARVHTPFVDNFIAKNYPGKEKEMFDTLSKTQPIGRMASPEEVAALAVYLCSDEAAFATGTDFPIDGGFIKLNG